MQSPLVTIVCLCYNQAPYVEDAVKSIAQLAYKNVQLIIADDASTDDSQQIILKIGREYKAEVLLNKVNLGHCKTFNKALAMAKGDFIIDLAADDLLLANSVSIGIEQLENKGEQYGVFYADAEIIDERGKVIKNHITKSFFKEGVVPSGFIYKFIVGKYFINPVTMIYRTSMMVELGGYDENLAYEDYDLWVRSSRNYKYCYSPIITVQKRVHEDAESTKQYIKNSKMLNSTLLVCKKVFNLNLSKKEDYALLKRLAYEGKMSLFSENYTIAFRFFILSIKVFFKLR